MAEKYEKEGIHADVIVVDPPRKGCDERCLETMVKMQPERIVYVSCDSATLARDVKYLRENGYEIVRGRGCDMFPGTVHTEVCVKLEKNGGGTIIQTGRTGFHSEFATNLPQQQ